ncbi:MAG TPA: LppP/LprE family lipoprotein [Solirubrobacteraceae bacterium]|nr:LppP/LprE family lipoprotein [Solirubrobacteraceae bacterium]
MARVRRFVWFSPLAGAALLLASCGGGTKTVTASNIPSVSQTTQATTPSTQETQSTQSTPTQTSTSTAPSTNTSTTRSSPEPAFTEGEAKAEGATGAAAVVRAHGYTPNDPAQYHSDQALGVLVGTRTGSADGYAQQAFFFVNGRYLGTDTKLPSATVKVVSQGDTEVTLGYALYRKGDPLANPSGGEAHVTFQLNNGKLVPLQKIPPFESSTGLSRQ